LVQLSLAGVAAYTAARLSARVAKVSKFDLLSVHGPHLPGVIAALLGVAAAVVVGLIIGLPAIRIRGVQLAVVTIAAVGPITLLLLRNTSVYGGAAVSNYPVPRPSWFGIYLGAADPTSNKTDYWHFSVFAVIVFALLGMGVAILRKGATGRRFLAVRANERAAAAAGIDVARTKLLGFGIAAAIAGVAGVVQSYRLGSLRPDNYSLFIGLGLFSFVYIGGITTVYGAIIGGLLVAGGLVVSFIDLHASGGFADYVPLIGAIGLILNAILNPEGLSVAWGGMGKALWAKVMRRGGQATTPVASEQPQAAPAGGQ
jgi:branched-chain amino acid transport system permease protein